MSNTLFVGKVYYRFDELPSTNDWAAQIVAQSSKPLLPLEGAGGRTAKTKPPEGTVVRAANQTAGRGQHGSPWHSSPGDNLLLSIILYPSWLEAQAQFYLSMAVALALKDLAQSLEISHQPTVKWPNDLYLGNRKTAGILIQNSISGSRLQSSIVGIGLNVNQLEFPEDLPHATSLAQVLGKKLNLDALEEQVFECVERRYLQLKAGNRRGIKAEYEENLWQRGTAACFVRLADGLEFEGVILGVTEQGMLRVETGKDVEEFDLKQVGLVQNKTGAIPNQSK
ncbi:MAG: biotin--[acetyl-CoA-carboxylase] ligase [Saprospiraceae bacterium]